MQLSEKLKVRFPRLFHEKVKIHVGDGWEHILTNMCCELVKYTGDIEINHIKEKFGVLRVDIHLENLIMTLKYLILLFLAKYEILLANMKRQAISLVMIAVIKVS